MGLKETLKSDLTEAIRSSDKVVSGTIRMVLTAITNEEVSGKEARTLSEDEIIAVLSREAKKRREAAEEFAKGNRPEKAAEEKAEGEVIAKYLPAQLSEDDVKKLIAAAIASMVEVVEEHMAEEQSPILPICERTLTPKEWDDMAGGDPPSIKEMAALLPALEGNNTSADVDLLLASLPTPVRAVIITFAPAASSSWATAKPIPREPPVTSAVCPFNMAESYPCIRYLCFGVQS